MTITHSFNSLEHIFGLITINVIHKTQLLIESKNGLYGPACRKSVLSLENLHSLPVFLRAGLQAGAEAEFPRSYGTVRQKLKFMMIPSL